MVKGVNRSVKKKRDTRKPVISYCLLPWEWEVWGGGSMVAESWMSQDKIFLILPIRLCNILMISHPPPFNASYLTHNFLHSPAPPPPPRTLYSVDND